MWRIVELQQKIVPELVDVMQHRLMILQKIELYQPIGRRALARETGMTERVLRGEVELLKEQGLIEILPVGMSLTQEGRRLVHRLFPVLLRFTNLSEWEEMLAKRLGLEKVYIVPGDSKEDGSVKKEMGRMAAHFLKNNIQNGDRIAVTGGTSIAAMAEMVYREQPYPDVQVYPARGGLGERVDIQANTIAARLADQLGGTYMLLQVPDHLSQETYQSLIEEPYIRERVERIRSARMIFHGIGNALEMARRREATSDVIKLLEQREAVSEAFGCYFNAEGQLVYQMATIGLRLEDLKDKLCIAVAGGSDKASAIISLAKTGIFRILVTDEGAAKEILT